MRTAAAVLLLVTLSTALQGQSAPPPRGMRVIPRGPQAAAAEMAVKQAAEQLGNDKKMYDRDLEVLRHLRAADEVLTDPMQPLTVVQKAYEEVGAAKALYPEFATMQGVIKVQEDLKNARLSPASADFGRLRAMIRSEAIAPAVKVVARNGLRLQEETLSWLKVQELIATHLRTLAELTGDNLRAAQQ